MPIPVIHDGDHGSDDFVTTIMLLARPDLFHVLGVTTCHGNVGVGQATINALKALELGGHRDIPVFTGCDKPWKIASKKGDNAFQSDGLAGVTLPAPTISPQPQHAVEWMATTIAASTTPVTLVVTGPMTNIATLLANAPDTVKQNIRQIVAMGGGFDPDGNITPHAEFNFYMDPDAADYVLNAGIPLTLHTLHSDHQMVFTPERQAKMRSILTPDCADIFVPMMRAAEHLDMAKFDVTGSFIHDEQTVIWLQHPHYYTTFDATAHVVTDVASPEHGRLVVRESSTPTHLKIVRDIAALDAAFDTLLSNVVTTMGQGRHGR